MSLLYCGSMTFGQKVGGVSVFKYENGIAEKLGLFGEEITSQSVLAKAGKYMVSISEVRGSGKIISYRILEDGALEMVNVIDSDIGPLCHITSSPDEKYVFVTCLGIGCLQMYRVEDDGSLTLTQDIRMTGHGFSPRQRNGKTHSSMVSPDGRLIACANHAADEIDLYRIDWENEKLIYLQGMPVDLMQMPRHLAFSADSTMLYLVTECGCRIYAYSVEGDQLVEKASYSLLTEAPSPKTMASDIRISPDGKIVVAAVRGENQIACFKVLESGLLDIIGHFPCGGDETRGLCFSKDGSGLLCANNGGSITRLSVDPETGVLGEAEKIADVPAAGSVMILG